MKRFFSFVLIILMLGSFASCSGNKNNLTMDDFVSAMENAGATLNEEPPLYQLAFAADGVMLDLDGKVVKIYHYRNEKDVERGVDAWPGIEEAPRNGMFVLDSSSEKALEIFQNVQ